MKNVIKNFLANRDETGRLIVHMLDGSGQKYFVEFIEPRTKDSNNKFGDIDPATNKVTGSYGSKYTGAIKAEDSLITEANGFKNIEEAPGGSYMWSVNKMHEAWKEKRGFVQNK